MAALSQCPPLPHGLRSPGGPLLRSRGYRSVLEPSDIVGLTALSICRISQPEVAKSSFSKH